MREEYPSTKQLRNIIKQACQKYNVTIKYSKTREANYSSVPFDQWTYYRSLRCLRTIEYRVEYNSVDDYKKAMQQIESWLLLSGKSFHMSNGYYFWKEIGKRTFKVVCTI